MGQGDLVRHRLVLVHCIALVVLVAAHIDDDTIVSCLQEKHAIFCDGLLLQLD